MNGYSIHKTTVTHITPGIVVCILVYFIVKAFLTLN